ncbi:lysozyme, partial [Lactococcus lactis subsp. lactis]|uniref:GH25 family lysozyme n=1 Tax=Lactococcus lactis TaxID=1358 RepID=UPI0021AF3D03
SSYQAELNAGIVPSDFVIIKATEGTNYINPTWKEQAGQVIQTNKLLGFYHFASMGNPIAEADFFISVVKDYIGKAVLVLDFEAGAINAWGNIGARQFLNRVKEKTGINPMIYMSAEVTRQFNWSTISNTNPLWVAQYASMNPTGYQSEPWTDGKGYGAWSSAAIHQYSSAGSLANWNGNLDINLAYINANQWKSLAGSGSTSNSITTEDININNTIEYEEEEMHFIQTVDTKRIYMINAGMYSWITDPGMWTNYQKAFPKAPVIPLYQAQMEKLYRKNV